VCIWYTLSFLIKNCKVMAEIANLLDKDGCKFKAKICDDPVSGEICVKDSDVFLLHNNTAYLGGSPTGSMRGYKASWSVHKGDATGRMCENVKDFELVVSNSAKFPTGTRVKLASKFTDTTTKFHFGGDITTIPSQYGVIASNLGWYDSYKSCKVLVRWDKGSASTYANYAMLESELELCSVTEEAKPAPRDIPGVHKFKVGDKIRLKSGITILMWGGAIRGDEKDNGEVRSCNNFNRTRKCMEVCVKFDDGRNYTMSEDELEFLPPAPAFHMFITGDIAEYLGKLWIVIGHASGSINMENQEGAKLIGHNHGFHLLKFCGHNDNMPIISVGNYLKAEHIETYAGWNGGKSPVGKVPPMATVKVTAIGKYYGLAGDPYHAFSFEWKGDIYDASLGKRNIYTLCDSREFVRVGGIETAVCSPGLSFKHAIDYLGMNPCREIPGSPYIPEIEWHVSASPEMRYSGPMSEGRARDLRDREAYEREMRYLREGGRAAYEERMRYGGDPMRLIDSSYYGVTRVGMSYMREPIVITDEPKPKVDPKTDREKYFCGTDPFEKEPTPTKDLVMKKEKKFSL
jgi:hypothetical protein